ncbi:MAG TPA: PilN domain-containing protein [Solirubrobacterales bacterium]|nr:PilN domain-containing protein [Solirubrobacterales bacterium]
MRAVNLLPRDVEAVSSGGTRRLVLAAAGGVAAVTLLAGILGMNASSKVDEQRGSLELTQAAIVRLPGKERQPVAPDMTAERSSRIAALQSALSTRTPVDRVMAELSYVVPEDVWLSGLTMTIPSEVASTPGQAPGADDTGATVALTGATYSQAAIARFLSRLSTLSALDNVRLTESSRVEPQANPVSPAGGETKPTATKKQKVVVTFTITADLRQGATS